MVILIILIILLIVNGFVYGYAVSYAKKILKKNGFGTPFYTELNDYKNLWFLAKQQTKYKPMAILFIFSTLFSMFLFLSIIVILFFTNLVG